MAKKKIIINNQELTPTVIAVKQDKKKSSIFGFIWIVFIFVILIGCVYYMPEISSYVKQYIKPDSNISYSGGSTITKNEDKEQEDKEIQIYSFDNSLNIKIGSFTFNNFKVNNKLLSFDITINNATSLSLEDYNYFITVYSESNQVLQRIKVADGLVKPGEALHKSYALSNDNVAKISLVELKQSEYPSYSVSNDANKNGILTCIGTKNTLKYYFDDNKLYAIDAIDEIKKEDSQYEMLVTNYKSLFDTYANKSGVNTEIVDGDNGTLFKVSIDLNKYTSNIVNNIVYYDKDTDARIVYFELNASGYTCS